MRSASFIRESPVLMTADARTPLLSTFSATDGRYGSIESGGLGIGSRGSGVGSTGIVSIQGVRGVAERSDKGGDVESRGTKGTPPTHFQHGSL